ncbi:hypothetical protein [Nocardioides sp.]|uniref:hypothetical protein n=1 Tax=Nocardioides sp. TaxID=35761 RepID=UPI002ED50C48
MPEIRRFAGYVERERAVACLRDVEVARAHLRAARDTAAGGWNKHELHHELLMALERYAAAVIRLGAPVPRRLRTEIDLYRRLKNRA